MPAVGIGGELAILAVVHRWILLVTLPLVVFWYPVGRWKSTGTLTLSDLAFAALWATTLLLLADVGRFGDERCRLGACIAFFAVLPGPLALLAAWLFDTKSIALLDVFRHMKCFGSASIIPLALVLSRPGTAVKMTWVASLTAVACILFQFSSLRLSLPVFSPIAQEPWLANPASRATGAVSNPNDLGYIALLGLCIAAGPIVGRWGVFARVRRLIGILAAGCCLAGIALSASRSAMAGFVVGFAFVLVRRRAGTMARLLVLVGFTSVTLGGWALVDVYRIRVGDSLRQGRSEINTMGRIIAQEVALRAWASNPLGVGFVNVPRAAFRHGFTSYRSPYSVDSVYLYFLLGSGLFGALSFVVCLASCWKAISLGATGPERVVYHGGILCALTFGAATVAPASNFVAPFFFALVAIGATLRPAPLRLAKKALRVRESVRGALDQRISEPNTVGRVSKEVD